MKYSVPKFIFGLLVLLSALSCSPQKTATKSADSSGKKFDFVITNIELLKQGEEKFLKLTIVDKMKNPNLYPYPLFRVESEGKVVAERGLTTYGLVETELIPTTLEVLPKNFSCTVFLSAHGSMGVGDFELPYPAP